MVCPMKTVTLADLRKNLPALLDEVARGESFLLQKGRRREIVPISGPIMAEPRKVRELGILSHRGKPVFKDWKISDDEFLALE